MSDCFDHALDAYESQGAYWDGSDQRGPSFGFGLTEPNPLFYFTKMSYVSIVAETEKAHLIELRDNVEVWFPKSLCKEWDFENKTVYIYTKVLKKNVKEWKIKTTAKGNSTNA